MSNEPENKEYVGTPTPPLAEQEVPKKKTKVKVDEIPPAPIVTNKAVEAYPVIRTVEDKLPAVLRSALTHLKNKAEENKDNESKFYDYRTAFGLVKSALVIAEKHE